MSIYGSRSGIASACYRACVVVALVINALSPCQALAQLNNGGAIAGTVRDKSGAGIGDVYIEIVSANDQNSYYDSTTTDASGAYRTTTLPAGQYKVGFATWANPRRYAAEWYDARPDRDSATPVAVQNGQDTTGVDAVLTALGSISGRVTDETGNGVDHACVEAMLPGKDYDESWTSADASGAYRVTGLDRGNYDVRFADCGHYPQVVYMTEWYDGTLDRAAAKAVSVALETDTPSVDGVLHVGGRITGTIRNADGTPMQNAGAVALLPSGEMNDGLAFTYTDASGGYVLGGRPPGDTKVAFYGYFGPTHDGFCSDEAGYAIQFYDRKSDFQSADLLTIEGTSTISGIDGALVAPKLADVAITGFSVENVPVRTDIAEVGTGLRRKIHVKVSNLGDGQLRDTSIVIVSVCDAAMDCQQVGEDFAYALGPGAQQSFVFDWDALRDETFGDVTLTATASAKNDSNCANNQATIEHYTIIGGTGQGLVVSH